MKQDVRKETGRLGEQIAVEYLQQKGWHLLHRNWSIRLGELDIIARDGETIVFVEVRTTTGTRFGYGFQSVDVRKQNKIRRLALHYLQQNRLESSTLRFDVISILLNKDGTHQDIHHIVGAF